MKREVSEDSLSAAFERSTCNVTYRKPSKAKKANPDNILLDQISVLTFRVMCSISSF